MREIKFRVWDKKESEWLAASDPNSLTYYGFHLFGEVMMMQRVHPEDLPDLVIEQYTGLKDRHGREIYEGDVIQFVTTRGLVMTKHVAWGNGGEWQGFRVGSKNMRDIEVIGNVHENPELLNEE